MQAVSQDRSIPSTCRSVRSRRAANASGSAMRSGLSQFGVNLTTLKPGAWSSQRHWHRNEDEFIYVLEGEIVLCEDHGETVLKPGDAAGFKANSGNGHCLINRTQRDAVYHRGRHAGRERDRGLFRHRHAARARQDRHALSAQDRRAVSAAEGVSACRRSTAPKSRSTNNRVLSEGIRATSIAGREKQKLGDAVGLTQFGVNIARIKAAFEVGAAPLARERGRIHLHARRRAGAARERRRDRAQAGRRRRLARQRRHRPLPDQPHRPRRALSRSRHPLEGRARALSRRRFPHGARRQGPPLDAQVRRADQGDERQLPAEIERMADNFKLDVDADGIALVTWDMPGTLDERDRPRGDRGAVGRSSRRSRRDAAIKGAVITSGKDTFCAGADLTLLEALTRTFAEHGARRKGEEAAATRAVRGEPQAVAALPAHRDLRQAVGRRDQRHRARRRLRAVPRLPPARRRRQRQDPRRPARGQDRPVPRRRRHAAHRAHDGAGRCAAIPAQGRPAPAQPRQGDEARRRGGAGRPT